jgi:hypothetical protein
MPLRGGRGFRAAAAFFLGMGRTVDRFALRTNTTEACNGD